MRRDSPTGGEIGVRVGVLRLLEGIKLEVNCALRAGAGS